MNVLLLSMPDSFEHMPAIVIRMPNGALSSLAGNVDPHHRVAVADLILAQGRVRRTVEALVREFAPDVVGLSVMTFVETSRGCTFDCSFCSIIEMRGRSFCLFPLERVLEDIRDAQRHGARAIFLVDDNITLNLTRFEALCEAIIRARLNRIDYYVQAMTSAIASHGAHLAPLMRRAGFRFVFLGIENLNEQNLKFLNATAKNTQREGGVAAGNASLKAMSLVRLPPRAGHDGACLPRVPAQDFPWLGR